MSVMLLSLIIIDTATIAGAVADVAASTKEELS